MDIGKLSARAQEELTAIVNATGTPAAMLAAEVDGIAPGMLKAMLAHELVAGHAAMMKLATKADGFLDRISPDHDAAEQDRGCREGVRLVLAAGRLQDRYRVGLLSLAKLKGWEGFRPKAKAAAASDEDPDDDGPGGTAREVERALAELAAIYRVMQKDQANGAVPPEKPAPAAGFRRGTLRHGNPSGDFLTAPRCGARTRAGCACRQPAMPNGRCRFHGGKSTGARTADGLARCRTATLRHGARSAEIIELRAAAARHGRNLRALARLAGERARPDSERPTPCPATVPTAASKETADEHGIPRMNAAMSNQSRGRSHERSAFIPSDLRSSAVKLPLAVAPNPRFERPTPCPATKRRRAAG